MNFSDIISEISIWSILLPVVVGCFDVKQLDEPSRYIFLLVLLATPPQLLTEPFWRPPQLSSIYNFYTLLEFLVIFRLLAYPLTTSWFRWTTGILIVGFATTALYSIVNYGWYPRWWNELVCVANISYMIWAFFYILEELLADRPLPQPQQPMFWYLAGLLLYAPCTIFVIALSYFIKDSTNNSINKLWDDIHGIFNTLMYLLFAIGLYLNLKRFKIPFSSG